MPSFPMELFGDLVDSVDHVDYVFYTYEFSMSMDNPQGVRYSLAQIGEEPAARKPGCKAIGRVFYQIRGRNAAAAELYFSPGCTYLEFLEGNEVVYASAISEVGIEFLDNQFAQLVPNYQPIGQ